MGVWVSRSSPSAAAAGLGAGWRRMCWLRVGPRHGGVKVRFVPFVTCTRSTTLAAPTSDTATIEVMALDMLDQFTVRRPVRLVGSALSSPPDRRPPVARSGEERAPDRRTTVVKDRG